MRWTHSQTNTIWEKKIECTFFLFFYYLKTTSTMDLLNFEFLKFCFYSNFLIAKMNNNKISQEGKN